MRTGLMAAAVLLGASSLHAQHCYTPTTNYATTVATYAAPYQQTLVLPVATFFPVYGAPYYGPGGGANAQRQTTDDAAEKRLATIEDNVNKLTTNVTQLTAAVTQLAESMKKKE